MADDKTVVLLAESPAKLEGDDQGRYTYASGSEHAVALDVP